MLVGHALRLAGWAVVATFVSLASTAGSVEGTSFLFQPVTLPLAAVVILAILPAESLGTLAQAAVDRLTNRIETEGT